MYYCIVFQVAFNNESCMSQFSYIFVLTARLQINWKQVQEKCIDAIVSNSIVFQNELSHI